MEIKFGLFSCDSHGQIDKDTFTKRMSKARFGDAIPQLVEIDDKKVTGHDRPVHRWKIAGKIVDNRAPVNCPALSDDPRRMKVAQRWEEVPKGVYDPLERLKVLDIDGVDGEVLFPNTPVQSVPFLQGDAEFELACVQAYNDGMIEFAQASDRFIPLALVPILGEIEATVAEMQRIAKMGYKGVLMVGEPSHVNYAEDAIKSMDITNPALKNIKHFCDPHWDPLWAACQDLGLIVNWHASAAISMPIPRWDEYEMGQWRAAIAASNHSILGQLIPNMVLTGLFEKYPKLNFVCAETGMGWLPPLLDICDHVWERERLERQGIKTRPSEQIRRQVRMSYWYEKDALKLRHKIGIENIMWMTDFPHGVSTYPNTWKSVEQNMAGIPDRERRQILYENALDLYRIDYRLAA